MVSISGHLLRCQVANACVMGANKNCDVQHTNVHCTPGEVGFNQLMRGQKRKLIASVYMDI